MKKEIFAAALLVGVFVLSLINVGHLDRLTASVIREADLTLREANSGNWQASAEHAERAMEIWDREIMYIRLTQRSADADTVHNALSELERQTKTENAFLVESAWDAAVYYLRALADAEKIRFESIV